jgi:hypothetical protein
MQYLECLSAALHDMAYTYQPAERMSTVLRAVMVELRGGPIPNAMDSFRLYKPGSTLVPARRGSTNCPADIPTFKRRQMSRPQAGMAGTAGSRKLRSMSMNMRMTTNSNLSTKPPLASHQFDADSERSDGFILITPRSEISHPFPFETPIDPSLPTPTSLSTSGPKNNTWMGAELDPSDSISQLANIHFPEIPALNEDMSDDMGGGSSNDLGGDLSHLDFIGLGEGTEWGGEWQQGGGVDVGSDLDGFPPQGTFGWGAGNTVERFGLMNG